MLQGQRVWCWRCSLTHSPRKTSLPALPAERRSAGTKATRLQLRIAIPPCCFWEGVLDPLHPCVLALPGSSTCHGLAPGQVSGKLLSSSLLAQWLWGQDHTLHCQCRGSIGWIWRRNSFKSEAPASNLPAVVYICYPLYLALPPAVLSQRHHRFNGVRVGGRQHGDLLCRGLRQQHK